jgi:NIPSNAP
LTYLKHLLATLLVLSSLQIAANPPRQEYYEIRIYHLKNADQEKTIDNYLKDALVPALHRSGVKQVGVFKPIGNDTAAEKKVYVLIPYRSLNDLDALDKKLEKDNNYTTAGSDYINAPHDNPPYIRFEKIILKAFSGMPVMKAPKLKGPREKRVYELRSYEGATEKLYTTKVKMFNTGDEVGIFDRLGFNAVFYAEVLAGKAMPNLMYMTTFDDKASRDAHWKAFGEDAAWNKLKADRQYDNTVSHIDTYFLYPTEYSDL